METTSKRTPSRCREWERQRRNKFNDAIIKLGEVVKTINKAKESSGKDTENVQYPKIEIIQKATLCLSNCAIEQTQLRAEILALQVKLDAVKQMKTSKEASSQVYIEVSKQDASTQVFIKMKKKNKSGKCVKLMMLQKAKQTMKEKPPHTSEIAKSAVQVPKTVIKQTKILPKAKLPGPENAIVVLPASPYLFPQRPLLFPSIPPALVLVNSNMQAMNKPSVATVIRNTGDITKTTMVNILPISAYSHPLSASKSRKGTIKLKNDTNKKTIKKNKTSEKTSNETAKKRDSDDIKTKNDNPTDTKTPTNCKNEKEFKEPQKNKESLSNPVSTNNSILTKNDSESIDKAITTKNSTDANEKDMNEVKNAYISSKSTEISDGIVKNIDKPKTTESTETEKTTISVSTLVFTKTVDTVSNGKNNKNSKIIPEKENISHDKYKENKLPNILETTLCDGTVEGGNARLELAEEFLAASPTAAFLMSFPLVSGNRADSPAEEPQAAIHTTSKETINNRRNELIPQSASFFDKSNSEVKLKSVAKQVPSDSLNKQGEEQKYIDELTNKETQTKISNNTVTSTVSGDNPFLNLPMTSLIPTSYISDPSFGLEHDCNVNKTTSNQSTSYVSSNNLFYKGDPFATVKNNIYSTGGITSTHEFNSLGLYPCAMEKYSSKNKSDYSNVEENLIKMGPSRLTYDIDLGWSHKSFDFVNCTTTSSTFSKDILTTVSAPYSTSYNPFNPEFHVPLVSNSNKKDSSTKTTTFAESISNFYSQPSNLWIDEVPFYTSSSSAKNIASNKPQHYLHLDQIHVNTPTRHDTKSYNTKQSTETGLNVLTKPATTNLDAHITEKFTKKSPNKMHINWMTSEVRSMQNISIPTQGDNKETHKSTYSQLEYKTYNHMDNVTKKQDQSDSNYFPITMHNYPTQTTQEEFQIWPSARPLGTAEVTIEPPPINLPTLVGDLALGPHDKKKNADVSNRLLPQTDIQNCGNFLSVTQLMNRSTDNMHTRYQATNIDIPKTAPTKENNSNFTPDINRKLVTSRIGSHLPQPSYVFNEPKALNTYDNNFTQFPQSKVKSNNKTEKTTKMQKNNYSAESLIRGGSCSQKMQDTSSSKFVGSQKYSDYNTPQDSVAQVSHFPPILDYSDNSYTGQQFSATTLYNTTTNTISNSFYSNFMPGSSNLMTGNYTSGPFTSDFIDYSQTAECNYSNNKYEELKMRSNPTVFQQDKNISNYKSSRRESGTKHKLECSKKESNKKCQNKRAKMNNDVDDWADTSHLLWQNKSSNKRHPNLVPDELPFTNYVSNQMTAQYQPELFNSHLMPSNMQSVGHNMDRSLATFPGTSRANFNLSTIFPEITMKVQ